MATILILCEGKTHSWASIDQARAGNNAQITALEPLNHQGIEDLANNLDFGGVFFIAPEIRDTEKIDSNDVL